MPSPRIETDSLRTRVLRDCSAERLSIVADVLPAEIDDVRVAVGSARVRITVERDGDVSEQTIAPLTRRTFTDDREAIYNNGVLTISLGTTEQ
ncbi:Hsp20/alpha crystallin family protein [Natrialbaceae archaeon A-arb3/5]